jgi:DcuC family C4-dicarboxylate transporter
MAPRRHLTEGVPVLILATLVIAGAIYLMVRRVEVRLVLLGSGLVMCLLAGQPLALADTFTRGMVTSMVAPICAAMGFAAVMSATGCDKHLVHLLLAPIRRLRWLALPGGILAAYLVNMAVPSQTSTAAALGPILVPLLLASGYAPVVAGAALILGASYGGDLLNPGSQDVQAIAGVVHLSAPDLSARVIPASIAGALVAAAVYALLNRPNGEAVRTAEPEADTGLVHAPVEDPAEFRLDPIRALIPLVPVALLLAAYGGFGPLGWLVRTPPGDDWIGLSNALPVVRAMLIGTVLAILVAWREVQALTRSFFDGMGSAYATIISLTITAQCFGAGIAAMGVAEALLNAARESGSLTLLSAAFPWALSVLSGSGSGPILTFAQTFLAHMDEASDTVRLAAMTCFGGAFGRTMSPVAAVVVYTAGLVGVSPVLLIRQFLPALVAGAAVTFALAAR